MPLLRRVSEIRAWQTVQRVALETLAESQVVTPNITPRTTEEAIALLALGIAGAAHVLPDHEVAPLARSVAAIADYAEIAEALNDLADELED